LKVNKRSDVNENKRFGNSAKWKYNSNRDEEFTRGLKRLQVYLVRSGESTCISGYVRAFIKVI